MPLYQMPATSVNSTEGRHFFVRHGDNVGDTLTEQGILEARTLADLLAEKGLVPGEARLFSADNPQSMRSVTLALYPDLPLTELATRAQKITQNGLLQLDPALRYTKFGPEDTQIAAEYQKAYDTGTTMRFYVHRSDEFLQRNPNLSTYTTIAKSMAGLLLAREHCSVASLNCGKQFLWPTLRAKLLEKTDGSAARDEYIDWYCEEKETSDAARLDIAIAQLTEASCTVLDNYGTFEVSKRILAQMATGESGD